MCVELLSKADKTPFSSSAVNIMYNRLSPVQNCVHVHILLQCEVNTQLQAEMASTNALMQKQESSDYVLIKLVALSFVFALFD